jgi:nucleoside-diphosphate-sugar epimerase
VTSGLAGKRVLVTGATGFIGTHVCRTLRELGAHVVGFSLRPPAPSIGVDDVRVVDLRDREAVRAAVARAAPDRVVHLAGYRSAGRDLAAMRESYDANLGGTINLAEAVIDAGGCARLVALGSAEEYGRVPPPFEVGTREEPVTPYGLSKLAATRLLQSLDANGALSVTVLRGTVVYGPGQAPGMLVPSVVRALVAGERFPMTAGDQTRDLVYVDDVVDGLLRALAAPRSMPGVLHLSSGHPISVRDVALRAAAAVGGDAAGLLEFGAVPPREGEAVAYWATNEATRDVLGWTPRVSLDDGLARTVAYERTVRAGT